MPSAAEARGCKKNDYAPAYAQRSNASEQNCSRHSAEARRIQTALAEIEIHPPLVHFEIHGYLCDRCGPVKCFVVFRSTRPCALRSAPYVYFLDKQQLVHELPKKRRRTEVSVPYSGGGGAIGRHNITLKIGVRVRVRSASALCTRALLAARVPLILKVKIMEVPSILHGDSLKRLLQGAAAGAAVAMTVGFGWAGWTLGSTVEKVAKERAELAVVAALGPICVDQFRQAANASANLTELNKISYAWDRGTFIEKGGWAIMPGGKKADSTVAKACAETLGHLKTTDLR